MLDTSAPGVLRLPASVWVRVTPPGKQGESQGEGESQGGLFLEVGPKLAWPLSSTSGRCSCGACSCNVHVQGSEEPAISCLSSVSRLRAGGLSAGWHADDFGVAAGCRSAIQPRGLPTGRYFLPGDFLPKQ